MDLRFSPLARRMHSRCCECVRDNGAPLEFAVACDGKKSLQLLVTETDARPTDRQTRRDSRRICYRHTTLCHRGLRFRAVNANHSSTTLSRSASIRECAGIRRAFCIEIYIHIASCILAWKCESFQVEGKQAQLPAHGSWKRYFSGGASARGCFRSGGCLTRFQ